MILVNIQFAWCWIMLGVLSGAVQGLGFHREAFMGGYDSWPRRLTRLGHIAFFGTALLNIAFAVTITHFAVEPSLAWWCSRLLILGAVAMPVVCYLAAWRKPLRHGFVIPVLSLTAGAGLFTYAVLVSEAAGG